MPCGEHIATCLHCGRTWDMVGDAIPWICPECEASGHKGIPLIGDSPCPECGSTPKSMRFAQKSA
jgi:predicted RNA-binding Zn-ribbon protein involved in translation (DUF1610 family)